MKIRELLNWRMNGRAYRVALALSLASAITATVLIIDHHLRWRLWLRVTRLPVMQDLPINTTGYTIERLPDDIRAVYVRGNNVYFADIKGSLYKSQDATDSSEPKLIGESKISPRMIFVSSRGTIFISGDKAPLLRSVNGGQLWETSHDWSFWRMTEDEEKHLLYAGNYSPKKHPIYRAKIFKSYDEGKTWKTIFDDEKLDHVHSVRRDTQYRNLYIAAGDGGYRGQAFSPDEGTTWHWINRGGKQGHTDLAISDRFVFWGSDDNLGRILRAPRSPVQDGEAMIWQPYHNVWWVVAEKRQIYAGTLTGQGRGKYTGAFLLASADEGQTWQRLIEEPFPQSGFGGYWSDSRGLSANGWLYFATETGRAYRVRRSPR